jgi:transcriptional regulator with XRE-family HTH domain
VTTIAAARDDLRTAGELIRFWRGRRRLSQLELALEANLSTKHLCFVETGRSQTSRQLLIHIAERLQIPLRDRNELLLAAGFAPIYPELAYDGDDLEPLRDALSDLLAAHEPNPAVIVDGYWNLLEHNKPAELLWDGVDEALLDPPVNLPRLACHPRGLPAISSMTPRCNRGLLLRLRPAQPRRRRRGAARAARRDRRLPAGRRGNPAASGACGTRGLRALHAGGSGSALHDHRDARCSARGDDGQPRDRDVPARRQRERRLSQAVE